jgi:hypothetical protein
MRIFLFRDECNSDAFAFSTDVTGANIPHVSPHTEWILLGTIETLKFADWVIGDLQEVLDCLKADGYCVVEAELIEQQPKKKGRQSLLEC